MKKKTKKCSSGKMSTEEKEINVLRFAWRFAICFVNILAVGHNLPQADKNPSILEILELSLAFVEAYLSLAELVQLILTLAGKL